MSSNPHDFGADRPTVRILTLGCKVNQFESAGLSRRFEEAGYRLLTEGFGADVTVINTCTVTHRADFEVRALARRAHRANPAGRTVLTGCLAQVDPEELAGLPGVVLVLGQDHKIDLIDLLDEAGPPGEPAILVSRPGAGLRVPSWGFPGFDRTRAFFRIQDGCSSACSYCIVPRARGPSRSLPKEDVLDGIDHYFKAAYAEIVLTGIHLGAWGQDLEPPQSLTGLLQILTAGEGGPRLRLSSIEPNEVTSEIQAMARAGGRVCPHLHLPLQSGSDRVLAAMGRPYSTGFFRELVEKLASDRPDFCLGADVLVGFPGEDEADFSVTRDLLEKLPLAYLHVFSYSRRPKTRAANLAGQVPSREIKRRVSELRELGAAKRQAFYTAALGTVREALVENSPDRATGLARGLTDNYIPVLIADPPPPPGLIVPVRLTGLGPEGRPLARAV